MNKHYLQRESQKEHSSICFSVYMCMHVSHCLTAHSHSPSRSDSLHGLLSLLATAAHITARVWIIWVHVEEREGKKRGCGQCKKCFEPQSVKTRGWWNHHLLSVVKSICQIYLQCLGVWLDLKQAEVNECA